MRKAHLICLTEADPAVVEAIKEVWSDEHRVALNDTQLLVAHRNGGKSVYDLIQEQLGGKLFPALIARVGEAHHGYQTRSLWGWLEEYV